MPAVKFLSTYPLPPITPMYAGEPVFACVWDKKYIEGEESDNTYRSEFDPLIYDGTMLIGFIESDNRMWPHLYYDWLDIPPPNAKLLILKGLHIGDGSGDSVYFYDINDNRGLDTPADLCQYEYQEFARYFLCVHGVRNIPFESRLKFAEGKRYLESFKIFPQDFGIAPQDFCQWLEKTVAFHEIGE